MEQYAEINLVLPKLLWVLAFSTAIGTLKFSPLPVYETSIKICDLNIITLRSFISTWVRLGGKMLLSKAWSQFLGL